MPEIINRPETPKPLKGKELNNVLKSLSEERGLDPTEVDRFLATDLEQTSALSKADKWIPAGLMAAHFVSLATVNLTGDSLPSLGTLPPVAHELLQAVHNLTVNAANSPAVRDHLPFLFLETAGGYGALRTLPQWFKLRGQGEKAREQQSLVREKIQSGEMNFKMAEGHTAAFVGRGDILADTLQTEKGKSMVMKYADVPISEEVWQLIKENGSQEEVFKALDRASFKNAGEVLILPVKAEDMVLPSEDGHDMSLDQISAKIKICADYCTSRKIAQKRIIVVGDLDHKESYSTRTSDRKVTTEIKTLRQVLNETQTGLQNEGVKIDIVSEDPTKDTISEVIRLAGGRKVEYHATRESDARYGKRFYKELKQSGYKVQKEAKGVSRVFYNIDDIPTEMNIDSDDIAIVLNKEVKERLLAKGKFKPENIICPTERMSKKLSSRVDET